MSLNRALVVWLLALVAGGCAESPEPPSQDGTGVEFLPDELQQEHEETLVAGYSSPVSAGALEARAFTSTSG